MLIVIRDLAPDLPAFFLFYFLFKPLDFYFYIF